MQPSEEELRTCRHVKNKLPWSVYLVALLGLAERFAYYGIIVMFRKGSFRDFPRILTLNATIQKIISKTPEMILCGLALSVLDSQSPV